MTGKVKTESRCKLAGQRRCDLGAAQGSLHAIDRVRDRRGIFPLVGREESGPDQLADHLIDDRLVWRERLRAHAATLRAVRFWRQPNRSNAPRPPAKSGRAAGSGVGVSCTSSNSISCRLELPVGPNRIDSPFPKLLAEPIDHVQNSSFADG